MSSVIETTTTSRAGGSGRGRAAQSLAILLEVDGEPAHRHPADVLEELVRIHDGRRRELLELATRLSRRGDLSHPDDIFFLPIETIFGLIEGHVEAAEAQGGAARAEQVVAVGSPQLEPAELN